MALSVVALVMCAVLVAAGLQRRGGLKRNATAALVCVVLIVGLAMLLTQLGWR